MGVSARSLPKIVEPELGNKKCPDELNHQDIRNYYPAPTGLYPMPAPFFACNSLSYTTQLLSYILKRVEQVGIISEI